MKVRVKANRADFQKVRINSYFASVLADFIRNELLNTKKSFSFETVMSFPGKIDFLEAARNAGYRNYPYFIATNDPAINESRVDTRVKEGGHDVPAEKIRSRYFRSLGLLSAAVRLADRAYIFDNSGEEAVLVAVIQGCEVEIKVEAVPPWFDKYFLKKI